jgi:hypothetical protein
VPAVLLRYYARQLTAPHKLRAFSRQAREDRHCCDPHLKCSIMGYGIFFEATHQQT